MSGVQEVLSLLPDRAEQGTKGPARATVALLARRILLFSRVFLFFSSVSAGESALRASVHARGASAKSL